MVGRFICWAMRHDHSLVRILVRHHEGKPSVSQKMDRWSADWIIANIIAVEGAYNGRSAASARIVTGD